MDDKKLHRSIDVDNIEDGNPPNGSIVFSFKQGSSLYIGFEVESGTKDTSFIQHLALSMLPPFYLLWLISRQIGYLKVGPNLRICHKNHLMGLTKYWTLGKG